MSYPIADELLERAEQLGLPPDFQPKSLEPLRVASLGCGTVGGGVLARLLDRPDLFLVTGIAVKNLKAKRPGVPRSLLTHDAEGLAVSDVDVVIELIGGREPAHRAIVRALERGRSVVTANKLLLAEEIESLSRLAERNGAYLGYSASVGGALPALETVRRYAGRVRALSGVLNGTCNFVLDRCSSGFSFEEAVAEAQAAGFAEADPALDLDGSDTAQKLALLAREAFGVLLPWERIPRQGILGLQPAHEKGQVIRLVASCERTGGELRARVAPIELPAKHPFAQAAGAGNALRIETANGVVLDLAAPGAG
ncbi:MAG TPA: homoserine dehydrogenase, partial [Thermoanaerobaculia bacterium]|nr:homoserine dehydrogenase [Thermoanaerobaculia bacterium]